MAFRRETCGLPRRSIFGRSIVALLGLALSFYGRYFVAVVAVGLVLALGIWATSAAARWWKEQ
jgi:hypothetical protein